MELKDLDWSLIYIFSHQNLLFKFEQIKQKCQDDNYSELQRKKIQILLEKQLQLMSNLCYGRNYVSIDQVSNWFKFEVESI